MEEVIKIFREIQNTSSLNEKQNIISANKNNELFKTCLVFLLDNLIVTGISDRKIKKNINADVVIKFDPTFESCMEYLKNNNTGTDVDIAIIQKLISLQPEEHIEFYEQMITKKLKLGADAKLVNKVIPNLIPTFDVMLGTSIEKCKLKDNTWISVSRKLNGTRCAFVGNKCLSRQGKEYTGLNHIIHALQSLGVSNYFVDGELVYKNEEGLSDSEAFQKGTGIAMSKDSDKSSLKLVVFDIFPLVEFWSGKSKETFSQRKIHLSKLQEAITWNLVNDIEIVERLYEGTNHNEIQKWLDYAEDQDWEGVMLNLDTPYECKRTKNLIKVKKFKTCDIRCIGIEEGEGRNRYTLGAIVCDYKGNRVNVGSGFCDEDRVNYWHHPDKIISHIVTVKYKEETKNKNGGISIQFPVFECVRFDKNEESYN